MEWKILKTYMMMHQRSFTHIVDYEKFKAYPKVIFKISTNFDT